MPGLFKWPVREIDSYLLYELFCIAQGFLDRPSSITSEIESVTNPYHLMSLSLENCTKHLCVSYFFESIIYVYVNESSRFCAFLIRVSVNVQTFFEALA